MKLAAVVGVAAVLLGKASRRDSMKAMLLAVGPSASAMMYRASRSDARTMDASYVTSAPALVPLNVLNMSGEFGTTAAPLWVASVAGAPVVALIGCGTRASSSRSEEHTSELQSQSNLVCRLLLEKKKKKN